MQTPREPSVREPEIVRRHVSICCSLRLHAAILADRLHPAAGDVEHTSIQVGYILHALVSYKRNWRHLAPLLSYCSENHRLQFSVEGTVEMFVLLLGRFF